MSEQTIIQGDCLEVMKTFADDSFDCIITDPPYNFTQEQKEHLHYQFFRVSKAIIVFSPPENQWLPPDQYGFWVKPISTKNTSRKYSRFVEMIFFYGDLKWNSERHWSQYTNVFQDLVDGNSDHPYEKPTSLIKRLVSNHTDVGDSIFDPFMGSGTTLVAAKYLNRNATGIEISEKYCEIARKRLSQEMLF